MECHGTRVATTLIASCERGLTLAPVMALTLDPTTVPVHALVLTLVPVPSPTLALTPAPIPTVQLWTYWHTENLVPRPSSLHSKFIAQ